METKKSTEIGDIQSRREETDYANRKRNLEWRQDWFYRSVRRTTRNCWTSGSAGCDISDR